MTTPSRDRVSPFRGLRLPILAIALGLPAVAAAGTLAITRWTVDGGGSGFGQVGTFILGGTAGQPDAGLLARLGYSLTGGFWVPGAPMPTGVGDGPLPGAGAPPLEARIHRVAPNPITSGTRIAFDLPDEREVEAEVFDVRGALVRTVSRGRLPAGRYALDWDVADADGRRLGPGLYLLRVRLGTLEHSQKLIVLR